jgi:hypothetical protein
LSWRAFGSEPKRLNINESRMSFIAVIVVKRINFRFIVLYLQQTASGYFSSESDVEEFKNSKNH